jgi:radical SAM-linked protein
MELRMVRDKVRIRFRKAGELRWTSHHDLLRCFERMLRRAALPFRTTEGFNPRPRLVFAQPLPLGVVGCNELADLELDAVISPEEIRTRLAEQAPPGLHILSVEQVDLRSPLQPRRAVYRLAASPERCEGLKARAEELLAGPTCCVERTRPTPRRVDIRPYLEAIRVSSDAVELQLAITSHGGARPEEVFRLLGLEDLLSGGAIVERTALEIHSDRVEAVPKPAEALELSGASHQLQSQ